MSVPETAIAQPAPVVASERAVAAGLTVPAWPGMLGALAGLNAERRGAVLHALQRSAGNRAVTRVLARWQRPDSARFVELIDRAQPDALRSIGAALERARGSHHREVTLDVEGVRGIVGSRDIAALLERVRMRGLVALSIEDEALPPIPERHSAAQEPAFPGLPAQDGPTCGPASLVAQLAIFDGSEPDPRHGRLVRGLEHALADARSRRREIRARLQGRLTPGAPPGTVDALYDRELRDLQAAIVAARGDDVATAFRLASASLYLLYAGSAGVGTSDAEASEIIGALGQGPRPDDQRPQMTGIGTFHDLFANAVVTSLLPGESVHTSWISGSNARLAPHFLVIGRHDRGGGYYLYDQASQYRREAPALDAIEDTVAADIAAGRCDLLLPGGARNLSPQQVADRVSREQGLTGYSLPPHSATRIARPRGEALSLPTPDGGAIGIIPPGG